MEEGGSNYVNCVRIITTDVTNILFLMKREVGCREGATLQQFLSSGRPAFNLT